MHERFGEFLYTPARDRLGMTWEVKSNVSVSSLKLCSSWTFHLGLVASLDKSGFCPQASGRRRLGGRSGIPAGCQVMHMVLRAVDPASRILQSVE